MVVLGFIHQRQAITRFVRDALQSAVDKQKDNADKHGMKYMRKFKKVDRVLLSTKGLRDTTVTKIGTSSSRHASLGYFEYSR